MVHKQAGLGSSFMNIFAGMVFFIEVQKAHFNFMPSAAGALSAGKK
jgi:hypothetical protein